MAKGIYVGVNSKAQKSKKAYVGVNNIAHKVKKAYIGDASGKAKLFYATGGKLLITRRTRYSNYLFDTSDKSMTAFELDTNTRNIPAQYANGNWFTAWDQGGGDSFGACYLIVINEKTFETTRVRVQSTISGAYTQQCQPIGLAVDETNIYIFVIDSSNCKFLVYSQSTLELTSATSISSFYIYGGSQTYPVNPWNMCVLLPNGKFVVANRSVAGTGTVVYTFDKSNNTFTQIYSATAGCTVHNRAISSSRVGFRANNVLCTTDGSSVKTGTTNQTYQSMNNTMAYGNGRWVATYGGRWVAVSTDDGANWTLYDQIIPGAISYYLYAITFADGIFYATAIDYGTSSSSLPYLRSSVDGVTWTTETALTNWTYSDVMGNSDLCFSTLHGVGNV